MLLSTRLWTRDAQWILLDKMGEIVATLLVKVLGTLLLAKVSLEGQEGERTLLSIPTEAVLRTLLWSLFSYGEKLFASCFFIIKSN